MNEQELIELHAIAKGRVQGVGFRATVRSHAIRLGLKGTVRNLPDGSVEIFAQGARPLLDKFLQIIQENFGSGRIASVSTEFYPPKEYLEHFSIIYR